MVLSYEINFNNADKVNGYLIAALEIQRVIKYRYNFSTNIKDLHDITMQAFTLEKNYFKKGASYIRSKIQIDGSYSYSPNLDRLTTWYFNIPGVQAMIKKLRIELTEALWEDLRQYQTFGSWTIY